MCKKNKILNLLLNIPNELFDNIISYNEKSKYMIKYDKCIWHLNKRNNYLRNAIEYGIKNQLHISHLLLTNRNDKYFNLF